MKIRNVNLEDLNSIFEIETSCFSKEEAASYIILEKRLNKFHNHFWALEMDNKLIGFVNGMLTNNDRIYDEMFVNVDLHDKNGSWQSIFGIGILPEYRAKGYAKDLINYLIEVSKKENRKGLILTCKESLVDYYEKIGFSNLGLSKSVHAGKIWYDMRLEFNN